jgi:heterotetrameric sarcosine oxidase gamma subunit
LSIPKGDGYVFEEQSPLAIALKSPGCDGVGGLRRLRIGEVSGWRLLQLAGIPSMAAELARAWRTLLGADPPARTGQAVAAGNLRCFRTGPAEYWVIARNEDARLDRLAHGVEPTIGAITSLSSSRTCIFLDGPAAREVLAKGVAIDLHPDVFPVDHFALTGLNHLPVLIHRSGAGRFHLYVMRSFALAVWEWLIDAALPCGYDIECDSMP